MDNNNLENFHQYIKCYISDKLNYNNNIYNFIGKALNKLYNQEYYLYEFKLNGQLYNYIFVFFINNKIEIKYDFGPRNKINNGDIIYLDIKKYNTGIGYIGPFIIK